MSTFTIELKLVGSYAVPGDVVSIEGCDEDMEVKEIKEIFIDQFEYNIDNSKMIYHQKILKDDTKLSELNYKEGTQILVFVSKTKPNAEEAPKEEQNKAAQEHIVVNKPNGAPLPYLKSMKRKAVCPPNRHRRTNPPPKKSK